MRRSFEAEYIASRRNGSRSVCMVREGMIQGLRITGVEAAFTPSSLSLGEITLLVVAFFVAVIAFGLLMIFLLFR